MDFNTMYDLVFVVLLIFWGFNTLVKKNGGSAKMEAKYTKESLAKYSVVTGICEILMGLNFIAVVLQQNKVLKIFTDDSTKMAKIKILIPSFFLCAIILIMTFTVLKKKDSASGSSRKADDNEEF